MDRGVTMRRPRLTKIRDEETKKLKLELQQTYETQKPESQDSDEEYEDLVFTDNGKFDILKKYFDISTFNFPQCNGVEKYYRRHVRQLKKDGALIASNFIKLQ